MCILYLSPTCITRDNHKSTSLTWYTKFNELSRGVKRIMEEKAEKIVLTVDEAALILGISRPTAYQGVERGEIPHIRVGKRILVPRVALEKMLASAGSKS